MHSLETYKTWISSNLIDDATRAELEAIRDNETEITERFYKNLEFGTGGLRGIMGAGTNRMNIYTVRKATQGLANYILKHAQASDAYETTPKVAIAYDSRNHSELFAEETALVLAANGIHAYLFEALRPTPELSFTVRHLQCDAGIVITASHNPPAYNGYKVYGADGGQITLEMAQAVIAEIDSLDLFADIRTCTKQYADEQYLLSYLGEVVDQAYIEKVLSLTRHPQLAQTVPNFNIVYTPLHGSGLVPIQKALTQLGYANLHIVPSQQQPDGNFPTVKSPNPEEREALTEGMKLAEALKADIVLGTDPDSDRVGVAVRTKAGTYQLLTGNQIGALLTHYLVTQSSDSSREEPAQAHAAQPTVIKTVVTSDLGAVIAKAHGAAVVETLTGFKFIGEKIKEFESSTKNRFLFGYEESYGYLAGTFVRDKDAVIAVVLIVEMAAWYSTQNKTLLDAIEDIYSTYGYYADALESFTFPGIDGQAKIQAFVQAFRNLEALKQGFPGISFLEDYDAQIRLTIASGEQQKIALPASNVIKLYFEDQSWLAVRPSGTEPKLKIYYSAKGNSASESQQKLADLKQRVELFRNQLL